MKTKLEMAHEWYLKHSESPSFMYTEVEQAWQYADAMQAEADKREKEEQDKLKQNERNHHDELVSIGLEEWQPDWSQAPDWANWWAMDENKNTRWIYSELEQPYISDMFLMWCAIGRFDSADAPSFGYTGNWRNSLRKRPK